jgi:hypothetical protein
VFLQKLSGVSELSSGSARPFLSPMPRIRADWQEDLCWTTRTTLLGLLLVTTASPLTIGSLSTKAVSAFYLSLALLAWPIKCHRYKEDVETSSYVTSHYCNNLPAIGCRHELVLGEIIKTITISGHEARVNRVYDNSILRPDISTSSTPNIINLSINFDDHESLHAGYARKIEK